MEFDIRDREVFWKGEDLFPRGGGEVPCRSQCWGGRACSCSTAFGALGVYDLSGELGEGVFLGWVR